MRIRSLDWLLLVVSLAGLLSGVPDASAQDLGPLGIRGPGGFFGPAAGQDEQKVTVEAQFTRPSQETPARLFITATIQPNWHIYSITQAPGGPIRTTIKLQLPEGVRLLGGFRASPPPERKTEPKAFGDLIVETHYGRVTWHAPIEIPSGVDPAGLQIEGSVRVQPCDPGRCFPPREIPFTALLGPGMELPAEEPAAAWPPELSAPPEKPTASRGGDELPWQPFTTIAAFAALTGDGTTAFDAEQTKTNLRSEAAGSSLWGKLGGILWAMLLGFAGGIILNIMPCVLPVIGLKILSFVEQAGHDRRKALMLNVWYSLGIVSVFVVLATLAVFAGVGWGQLFSYKGFTITLAAVVFVMGLSFLGVWEVPIPGFVGRGKASQLAQKEGPAGALAKGVLTTVLATPCSAPLLATALTWTVTQPPLQTYVIFLSIGLGMASPYLLIGAFPKLIRFLPKPGAWMDTFKQIMGFVLLGTVVFIFTFLELPYLVPTIGLLFGLWAACWWIGRTPAVADAGAKARAWLEAAAFAGVVWIVAFPGIDEIFPGRWTFGGLADVMQNRYRRNVERVVAVRTAQLQLTGGQGGQGGQKTVMIDFTADWCLTCKTLEATVLNTSRVRQAVENNGVVPLQADWTHGQPEVTEMLETLGGKQVPVLAIFPAGNPNRPIVLRGGYTQRTLLDALQRAGPSKIGGINEGSDEGSDERGQLGRRVAEKPGAPGR